MPTSVLNAVGTYEVNGRILDKDGGQTTYTTTITVDPPPNTAPIADAGPDQEVNAGDTVTLDGTGSTDPDEDELTYSWVQTAGPAVTLTGATTAQPTFTAPTGPATLTFELTVDDGAAPTPTRSTITVNGIPTADAGPDQDGQRRRHRHPRRHRLHRPRQRHADLQLGPDRRRHRRHPHRRHHRLAHLHRPRPARTR